jgi:KipI family sensor histidine kinase inhibitor
MSVVDATPATHSSAPLFLDAGEAALVVEYGRVVDPAIHDRVLALDEALLGAGLPGLVETVPTFRSLMVHYDPLVLPRAELVAAIRALPVAEAAHKAQARWTIPVCYEGAHAEDLGAIAEQTGLTPDQVIAIHSGAIYRVYMYGFAPGFCYLGGLPRALAISRRLAPRPPHPENTILLGGGMTLVSTFSMPTAWWLIGQTPERMFSRTRENAFLVAVGDELAFEPISAATFASLLPRVAAGEVVATCKALS